jgi:predicted Zn-dependent peptidase
MDFQTHTLTNGIRLIHLQKTGGIGHCGVFLNTGSRDEKPGEEGMVHFIEHLLFKGTKKRKPYHILSRMEDAGGELNAFTTKEETFIYSSFLKQDYPRALELLADMILRSEFPEKEIGKERDVVLDEISAYDDNPVELIYDEFENLVFEGQPLGHFILGQPASISRMTRNDIVNFFQQRYYTSETVIASIGDIHFTRLVKLAEKFFASAEPKHREIPRPSGSQYQSKHTSFRKNTNQAHCVIGVPGYSYTHPNRPGLLLLSNILGGQGLNSRLNLTLREKRGYAYTVETSYNAYSDTGIFSVYFGTDHRHLQKSINLTLLEFQRLCDQKLGPVQLERAKKQMTGILIRNEEHPENLLPGMAKSLIRYGNALTLEDKIRKIEECSPEEIMQIANETFIPDQISVVIFE